MRTFGMLAGLTAAGIWGGMYVVSKIVLEVIPPFTLLTIRLILGALALAIVAAFTSHFHWPRRDVVRVLGIGALGFGLSVGLQFVGTALSTAAHAALITSASPAFIVLFGALLLKEPVTGRRLAALLLASIGVVVVLSPGLADWSAGIARGNLALIAAAVTWALYSVLVKRATETMRTLDVSLLAFLGGLLVSVPMSATEGVPLAQLNVTPAIGLGVLYLGLVSTALAMYLWNVSLAILEAGLVSLLFFAQPVVGVGLGAVVLGEKLLPSFWIGGALIALGLLLNAAPARRQPAPGRADPQESPE